MGDQSDRGRAIPYDQRETWILRAVRDRRFVDVLNADFVSEYAAHTGATMRHSTWGAGWCGLLSADLRKMHKKKILRRTAYGLSGGAWQPGFPKWVYSYSVARVGAAILQGDHHG